MDEDLPIHRASNFILKTMIVGVESRRLVKVISRELFCGGSRQAAESGQAGSSDPEPGLSGIIEKQFQRLFTHPMGPEQPCLTLRPSAFVKEQYLAAAC